MLQRFENATASMVAMTQHQERIANNLANANTTGYQRDRVFMEALNERIDNEGAPRSDRVPNQWADQTPGSLENTGNPLDLAIDGEGYFAVLDENGNERFTRAGDFTVDANQTLRTASGHAVQGIGGPIQVPDGEGAVEVTNDGRLSRDGNEFGQLRVVGFEDPSQLERLDGSTFAAEDVPVELNDPSVVQGHLEGSNVDPIAEMNEMINHHRRFEMQQRMMRTNDELLGRVTRELGQF